MRLPVDLLGRNDDWSGIHILTPNNVAFSGPGLDELTFAALAGDVVRAFHPGVRGRPLEHPELTE